MSAAYNVQKLDKMVAQLPCFQEDYINEPKDAYLRETDSGYELVKAEQGNQIRLEDVRKLARDAVDMGEEKLVLTDDVYEEPKVKSNDKKLKKALKNINSYLHTTIKYDVGETGKCWIRHGSKTGLRLERIIRLYWTNRKSSVMYSIWPANIIRMGMCVYLKRRLGIK
ncbi:hypothetical protein C823_003737 [Eubacterium plexicaudatum ASF492]|nr:hypothetical protein C823_003737 [Eubacterium plexicaudatum ASF492]